jgi:hypothetical protein
MIEAAMLDEATVRAPAIGRRTNNETHRQRLKGTTVEDAAPCDGCKFAPKCATGFACRRFAEWVRTGRDDPSAARAPSRSVFLSNFPEVRLSERAERKLGEAN